MVKWIITGEKVRTGRRREVLCPNNVTGSVMDRIAQSKRVRAGSLDIVD